MKTELLTKKEIEKFGFKYEPDASKCKAYKLKLYVPQVVDDFFKKAIADEIMFEYVNEVIESPNPYAGDPHFLSDPKVIVRGHTKRI